MNDGSTKVSEISIDELLHLFKTALRSHEDDFNYARYIGMYPDAAGLASNQVGYTKEIKGKGWWNED